MNSDEPDYHGLLSDEEISIIKKVIRKFCSAYGILKNYGFEDLMQEIVLELYLAKAKYKVLNKSAIVKIARNNLIKILRKQKTQKEQINYIKQSLHEEISKGFLLQDMIGDGINFEKNFIFGFDVKEKLKKLTKLQGEICKLSGEGYTQKEIGKKLNNTDRTIRRELIKIRKKL